MIKRLLELGAEAIKEPSVYRGRGKAYGYMWGGDARLKLNDVEYYFELWHHGGDLETTESLLDHFRLKGIGVEGKYYDTYWYTIISVNGIWLHESGWFYNHTFSKHELIKRRGNPNFHRPEYTEAEEKELEKLGFRKLINF
jgi:hypothetical protein